MIVGDDFVWLHFPKCGGTSVEAAMKKLLANRPGVVFDSRDPSNVIWHQNIQQREQRDASFKLGDRKVFSCFRRLPHWILSRVIYEAQRSPHVASREMILNGQFFEYDGRMNRADAYVKIYSTPRIDRWLRTENLVADMVDAFGFAPEQVAAALGHRNKAKIDYIKDLRFWFTPSEVAGMYEANPLWAKTEMDVYGSLILEP